MKLDNIHLHHADNLTVMATLPDESIDIICIDPPYLYLKNQKLERVFDEPKFFAECKRLLTKKGFIVMFGRGTSFYRWNTILDELGFTFKEEVIWNKRRITTPILPLGRVHETITFFTKGNGNINNVIIPYDESKRFNIDKIHDDVKRIGSTIKNPEKLNHIIKCLKSQNTVDDVFREGSRQGSGVTYNGNVLQKDVGIATLNSMLKGCKERSIIDDFGVKYQSIHPTQKPVRLLERLLNLVLPKGKESITIADFFAGSGSTMEAVLNLQEQNPDKMFKGIATEIDEEYFKGMQERIERIKPEPNLFTTY